MSNLDIVNNGPEITSTDYYKYNFSQDQFYISTLDGHVRILIPKLKTDTFKTLAKVIVYITISNLPDPDKIVIEFKHTKDQQCSSTIYGISMDFFDVDDEADIINSDCSTNCLLYYFEEGNLHFLKKIPGDIIQRYENW